MNESDKKDLEIRLKDYLQIDDGRIYLACYHSLIEVLNYDILIFVDEDDWQGDSLYLLKNNDKYGLLKFGWGSCSGCDALQACESFDDVYTLLNNLNDEIIWFDSKDEINKYLFSKDWDVEYLDKSLVKNFLEECKKIF